MKENFKLLTFGIILVLAISFATACLSPSNLSNNQGQTPDLTKNINSSDPTGAKKDTSDFPNAPPEIFDAEIKLINGKTYKISDGKAKVVLLNMWATWCGPCKAEMPELVKLQEEYGSRGLQIVGVDTDPEPEAQVKSFVEKQGLTYEIGWASDEMREAMMKMSRANGIPLSFLITKDGKVGGIFMGFSASGTPEKLKKTIEDLLNRVG